VRTIILEAKETRNRSQAQQNLDSNTLVRTMGKAFEEMKLRT